jgi:hypothetical protein
VQNLEETMIKAKDLVSMKARLRLGLALGVTCLVGALALLIGYGSVGAINGFSTNQELPLPLLAPIGKAPLAFIVRGLEPSVRVAPDGTVYVSSIRGVPTGVDLHRYFQPTDCPANNCSNTYPFKYEGQPDNCGILANGCANNKLDPLGLGLGGGDVDIAVNYPTSGVPNLALVSLTLAPGVTGTHSTDRGDTFSAPDPVVALIPGDDRQWIDGINALNVYLNYHDVPSFNIEVQRSNDGGETYRDGFAEAIDPQTFPAAGGVPATNTANVAGQIKVDRSRSCPSNGNLYQVFVAPDNVTENLAGGPLRSVYVGVSTDVKLGLPVFTFTDSKVFTGPVGSNAENIFPALAVDDFGFVYAVWSDNSNVFYSFSTDQGTTWSNPIKVSFPINGGHANVFPWVAADANGHVGIVWFGDDRAGNSNDRATLEPCLSSQSTTCMTGWAQWNVYFAESINGHDSSPTFVPSIVSDHPDETPQIHYIHRGTVSTGGLGGGANRNLADLFQIAFDRQHGANVAFSDDHKLSPVTISGHTGFDDPQARRLIRANFTHQLMANPNIVTMGICAGPPPPPPPGAEKITGGGQIPSVKPGLSANFGFVAQNTAPNASLSYHDDGATGGPIDVHSVNTTVPVVTFSGNCGEAKGAAKVNQQLGYTYTADACDNGGTGKDTFSISVSGGLNSFNYNNSGTLTSGNMQIHKQ